MGEINGNHSSTHLRPTRSIPCWGGTSPQTPQKCERPRAPEQDGPMDLLHRAMKDFDDMEARYEHFAARSLAALQCVRSLTQVYHGDPRYTHYISILRVLAWVSLWVWFDSSFCHWKGLRWCYLRFVECLQQCCFGEHHVRPRDVMHAPTLGL